MSTQNDPPIDPLHGLPQEIRDRIYKYVLHETVIKRTHTRDAAVLPVYPSDCCQWAKHQPVYHTTEHKDCVTINTRLRNQPGISNLALINRSFYNEIMTHDSRFWPPPVTNTTAYMHMLPALLDAVQAGSSLGRSSEGYAAYLPMPSAQCLLLVDGETLLDRRWIYRGPDAEWCDFTLNNIVKLILSWRGGRTRGQKHEEGLADFMKRIGVPGKEARKCERCGTLLEFGKQRL